MSRGRRDQKRAGQIEEYDKLLDRYYQMISWEPDEAKATSPEKTTAREKLASEMGRLVDRMDDEGKSLVYQLQRQRYESNTEQKRDVE